MDTSMLLDTYEILRPYGIEGMHLVGASHAPDMFYPYLWMLGGEIFEMKNGHPKHGSYWFPTFNSSGYGVRIHKETD